MLTEKRLFKPHTTSFSLLVGAHPSPSIEFCLNKERQISPSSLIFGCHNFVKHLTTGGWKILSLLGIFNLYLFKSFYLS